MLRQVGRWQELGESWLVEARGPLPTGAWTAAARALLERRPAAAPWPLRGGRGREGSGGGPEAILAVVDLEALPASRARQEARVWAGREARRPFDLATGSFLRLLLFRLQEQEGWLAFTVHPMGADRRRGEELLEELLDRLLEVDGEPPGGDGAARVGGEALPGEALDEALSFWRERLAGSVAQPDLPFDRVRGSSYRRASISIALPPSLCSALEQLGRGEGADRTTVLLAALAGLLWRYGNRHPVMAVVLPEDPPAAKPSWSDGCLLPVGWPVVPSDGPSRLVREAATALRHARRHRWLPLYAAADRLGLAPTVERRTLLSVALRVRPPALPRTRSGGGLELSRRELASGGSAAHELVFEVEPAADGGARVDLVYNGVRFEERTVKSLAAHWHRLLEAFAGQPGERLDRLPMLASAEREVLVRGPGGGPGSVDSGALPLHEHILEHGRKRPRALAVVHGNQELGYRDLVRRSGSLAVRLRALGAGSGRVVAVLLGRSLHLPEALLAILRSGAAYLPLDPAAPAERNRTILEEAEPVLVLCDEARLEAVPEEFRHRVVLSAESVPPGPAAGDGEALARPPLESPAYRIYTSGTTGVPNGVTVTHRNLLQAIVSHQQYYAERVERMLLFPPIAFDSSVVSLFWTLADGGCLVVPDDDQQRDPAALEDLVDTHRVTHWLSVPSAYQALLRGGDPRRLRSLRTVVVAGEECPPALVAHHRRVLPAARLYNEYGPTEGSVWSSVHVCAEEDEEGPVSIGWAVPGVELYNLDPSLNLLPAGVEGELFLGGAGVTAGYHRRPRRTAERFLPNPFATDPGERMYRTGDRVQLRSERGFEYRGRRDSQIKVRGYRVQIEEVEAAVSGHPEVQEAAVVAWSDRGRGVYLAAYVCADGPLDARALHADLGRRLPAYMVPSAFLFMEALPRTPNGKVRRHALPAPADDDFLGGRSRTPPRSATERRLATLWCEVLGLERVGIEDDFFQRGGHSLLATRLAARIADAFGVRVPMLRIFDASVLEEMADEVEAALARAERPEEGPVALPSPGPEEPAAVSTPALFCVRSDAEETAPWSDWGERLEDGTPLRELVAPDLRFELDVSTAADEVAEELARRVRAAQPDGPFRLGGTVAAVPVLVDLAERLSGPGEPLALLTVLVSEDGKSGMPVAEARGHLELARAAGARILRGRCDEIARLLEAETRGSLTPARP